MIIFSLFLELKSTKTLLARDNSDNKILGFIVKILNCEGSMVIGPLIAEDESIAEYLLVEVLKLYDDKNLFGYCFLDKKKYVEFLLKLGF